MNDKGYLKPFSDDDLGVLSKKIKERMSFFRATGAIKDKLKILKKGVPYEETFVSYMDRHGSRAHTIGERSEMAGHLAPSGTSGASNRTKLLPVVASHLAEIMQDK